MLLNEPREFVILERSSVEMTKQRFVIDEFCSEKQNESMTFFVIGKFISGWSHAAWVKLMPCGPLKNERANDSANIE